MNLISMNAVALLEPILVVKMEPLASTALEAIHANVRQTFMGLIVPSVTMTVQPHQMRPSAVMEHASMFHEFRPVFLNIDAFVNKDGGAPQPSHQLAMSMSMNAHHHIHRVPPTHQFSVSTLLDRSNVAHVQLVLRATVILVMILMNVQLIMEAVQSRHVFNAPTPLVLEFVVHVHQDIKAMESVARLLVFVG